MNKRYQLPGLFRGRIGVGGADNGDGTYTCDDGTVTNDPSTCVENQVTHGQTPDNATGAVVGNQPAGTTYVPPTPPPTSSSGNTVVVNPPPAAALPTSAPMSTETKILAGAAVVAAGVVGYALYKHSKKKR